MKKQDSINSMVLLRGAISKLERTRRSHDFVLTQIQHQQIGATAIAASAMGMGATSIGLIGMAGSAGEDADWVEFELNGKQIKGWLWMMPMRNGDNVEVVAEHMANDRYVVYAVKRDSDDLLAVYPHATAGRKVHYRKSAKVWIWYTTLAYLSVILMFVMQEGSEILLNSDMQHLLPIGFSFCSVISAVIAFRVSRKLMAFVRIAEVIFETFGWTDVKNIDLRKTSRQNRRENKLSNFGNLYFRYK
nr:putative type VI secretion system effector [uncultured Massilia sp.]